MCFFYVLSSARSSLNGLVGDEQIAARIEILDMLYEMSIQLQLGLWMAAKRLRDEGAEAIDACA